MRLRFFIVILLFLISFFIINESNLLNDWSIKKWTHTLPKESKIKNKDVPEERMLSKTFKGDLFKWMGKPSKQLINQMGEPLRKDLSAYGYTWWIYTDFNDQYIQFGMSNDKVVTIFATGDHLETNPVKIGQEYHSVNEELLFDDKVMYRQGVSTYQFALTSEELIKRPLVKITDDVFVQLYFDTFTQTLSSLRILKGDILLKQRPYQMVYRGSLDAPIELSEEEWLEVEKGMERQIFDITNMIRKNYDREMLEWEESVREVAFFHSKDMEENDYFSHYDPQDGGLKDRLAEKNIVYFSAGENISAKYSDAPAVITGWLNSEGHREALLNENYTHLGVGVYRDYYTQNFLEKH